MSIDATPDEVEALMRAALRAGDIPGVGMALRVMAAIDPHRAEVLLETLQLGAALASPSHETGASNERA